MRKHIGIWLTALALLAVSVTVALADIRAAANAQELSDEWESLEDARATIEALRPLADEGDPRAQFDLGEYYASGFGVVRDIDEAERWFLKAAEQGLAKAQYRLGMSYHAAGGTDRGWEKSAQWMRKAAEQGHAGAQHELGVRYAIGRKGVTENNHLAAKWLRKAAEQGDEDVYLLLAELYVTDEHLAEDYKETVKWLLLASEQGRGLAHAAAQNNLGVMYAKGTGILNNNVKAHMWYNIAGANGDELGARNRANIEKKMTPAQIAEAQKLAREWMAQHP